MNKNLKVKKITKTPKIKEVVVDEDEDIETEDIEIEDKTNVESDDDIETEDEENNDDESNDEDEDESNDEDEDETDNEETVKTKKSTMLELTIIDKANENRYFVHKEKKETVYINFDDKHYPLLTQYEISTLKNLINYIKPVNKTRYDFVKEIRENNYCDIEIERKIGNIIVVINIKELEWSIEDLLD